MCQGNTDESVYHNKADNLVELTPTGAEQARTAGLRIKRMLRSDDVVAMHVSPFERTLETAHIIRRELGAQVSVSRDLIVSKET